jgi:hypothetical protein
MNRSTKMVDDDSDAATMVAAADRMVLDMLGAVVRGRAAEGARSTDARRAAEAAEAQRVSLEQEERAAEERRIAAEAEEKRVAEAEEKRRQDEAAPEERRIAAEAAEKRAAEAEEKRRQDEAEIARIAEVRRAEQALLEEAMNRSTKMVDDDADAVTMVAAADRMVLDMLGAVVRGRAAEGARSTDARRAAEAAEAQRVSLEQEERAAEERRIAAEAEEKRVAEAAEKRRQEEAAAEERRIAAEAAEKRATEAEEKRAAEAAEKRRQDEAEIARIAEVRRAEQALLEEAMNRSTKMVDDDSDAATMVAAADRMVLEMLSVVARESTRPPRHLAVEQLQVPHPAQTPLSDVVHTVSTLFTPDLFIDKLDVARQIHAYGAAHAQCLDDQREVRKQQAADEADDVYPVAKFSPAAEESPFSRVFCDSLEVRARQRRALVTVAPSKCGQERARLQSDTASIMDGLIQGHGVNSLTMAALRQARHPSTALLDSEAVDLVVDRLISEALRHACLFVQPG